MATPITNGRARAPRSGKDQIFDVAIAGASHAGLALALSLARSLGPEVAVALIEQRALDKPGSAGVDPRAFAIAGGSQALLEAVGVWPLLEPHAQPVTAIDITDSRTDDAVRPVLVTYENMIDGKPQTYIVEASRLGAALLSEVRKLPSVTIFDGVSLSDCEVATDAVSLNLRNGDVLRTRLAVAADGTHSRLREAVGISASTIAYGQTGIVTTVTHELPHEARAVQHFLPAGPFALLPLPGDRSCVTWSEETATASAILASDDDSFLAEIQRRAGWRRGALRLDGPRASWPLDARMARTMSVPRVVLIGDAARSVHPIAGQGVNLAFRDCAALVEALADGMRVGLEAGDATIAERYVRWRRFDGVQATAAFTGLNTLFSNDNMVLRGLRDAGLGVVHRMPGLKQWLVSEAAGLTGNVPRLLKGQLP